VCFSGSPKASRSAHIPYRIYDQAHALYADTRNPRFPFTPNLTAFTPSLALSWHPSVSLTVKLDSQLPFRRIRIIPGIDRGYLDRPETPRQTLIYYLVHNSYSRGVKETRLKLRLAGIWFALALPAFGQYAGPAILSRGEAPAAMAVPEIKFRPFIEVSGVYDSGLASVSVKDAQGELADAASYGMALSWGVSGTHSWKHTKLGLNYVGDVAWFAQQTQYAGVDQSFLMGITHQLARHVQLSLRESAGIFSRDIGGPSLTQTVQFDPTQSYVPTTDFFDNRTIYLSSQANLQVQMSTRLSFNLGGAFFTTRRRSSALDGVNGESATGDLQYRISRRTTIGANYGYTHYEFTRSYGYTDAHSASLTYATRLSAYLELSASAGATRIDSRFIQVVPIDPTILALLGITSATEVEHNLIWIPSWSGRLSRTVHRGVFAITASRTVVPGNGLFATSTATNVSGSYAYTGLRKWSLSAGIVQSWADALGTIQGRYSSTSGTLSTSRQIFHTIHFVLGYSARQYNSPNYNNYNRIIHEAHTGLAWTPGEVPLRIW